MFQQSHFWVYTQKTWKPDSNRYLYTCVHGSIIHNSQKVETTQLPINRWTDRIWYICTMEYCSALKRKEILIHGTTWMNLEDTERSETSQLQKETDCMIPLIWSIQGSQNQRERERSSRQREEAGWGSYCLMGTECRLEKMTKFWWWLLKNVNTLNTTEFTLKNSKL